MPETETMIEMRGVSKTFAKRALVQNRSFALREIDDSEYRVLLSHNPEVVKRLGASRVDLVLSGHTHGGQVNLPWIGSLGYRGGFPAGLHLHGDTRLFVNRGLGCLVLPFRIGAKAEITLHLIKG